ncbi:hypothetical protein [Pseudonocardia hydrocarbonoxydans]|uniref:hypothetical protein n=1 Tax=Pseudonocardia hydrocarbonoxydans TaxID=76726 RepID=UPI0011422D28|nr:hypothetical protein [Pseudonocardia hydrocarbonoxydans]
MTGPGWVRPWVQLVEIACSAPVVIAYRTVGVVTGGWPPSPGARREYRRMVQEKAEGFTRAAVVAVTTPPADTARFAAAVLAPVHRRVVANRRRLTR